MISRCALILSVGCLVAAADPVESFEFDETVGQDLKLELWAQSPMIHSPVAMDVDPKGRLWVVEDLLKSDKQKPGARSRILVRSRCLPVICFTSASTQIG
jgi:hypothetical protein